MDILLASTSPYRKSLLERLCIPFRCVAPDCDESPAQGESPNALSARLSTEKAHAVSKQFPDALVIGSDQVASLDGQVLSKPGNHQAATSQLQASSGREVHFHTGVAVLAPSRGIDRVRVELYKVQFRDLDHGEIERYLEREQPYDCAGSFKAERLGISLFSSMEGQDPSSLIGLPLIALSSFLRDAGLNIP